VFWTALVFLLVSSAVLVIYREASLEVLQKVLSFLTKEFGAFFLWFAFLGMIWLGWMAWGPYGGKRFGTPDSRPDYSTLSWFGMLFCAGIGSNLLYFGTMEWMWYYLSPPVAVGAQSPDAAAWAGAYSFFHWGISAWAIYGMATLPIAYVLHVKRSPELRLSTACRGLLGDRIDGALGKAIDVLFIFGLVGGVGTSLGVGIPMVSAVASRLFGVTQGFGLDVALICALTAVFSVSVSMGLDKGIKRLSDLNVGLAIGLLTFILLVGSTGFILNYATDSLGLMLQNFVRMSLRTDPVSESGFAQNFTVFYWAWWVAWAPFMGLFVARISGGRTIRQVVLGVVGGGSVGCWTGFAILGGSALDLVRQGRESMTSLLNVEEATSVDGPAAVVALLESLPFTEVVLVVFFVLAFVFVATSLDSAAFTLSAAASADLPVDGQPPRWHRLLWALVLGGSALTLMYLGGLKVLQAASVVVGFPLMWVMIIAIVSLMRGLREEQKGEVDSARDERP